MQNGCSVSFWYDNWASMDRLIDFTRTRGSRDLGIPLNYTLRQAETSLNRTRRHRSEALNMVQSALDQLILKQFSETEDILLWRHGPDKYKSCFSSKLTWTQIRNSNPLVGWSKAIWFKYSIPKFAFLSWLALKDRLTTKDRMLNWSAGLSPSFSSRCALCSNSLETHSHLFISCGFSSRVWSSLARGLLGNIYMTNWANRIPQLTSTALNWEVLFLLRLVFQTAIYHVWRERNNRQHGEPPITAPRLILLIDKSICNRLNSIRSLGDNKFDNIMIKWLGTRSLP